MYLKHQGRGKSGGKGEITLVRQMARTNEKTAETRLRKRGRL